VRTLPLAMATLALVLVACPKKRDDAQAAKARIFGKDLPTPALEKRAAEPIDARGLASDPALARRALTMSWEELVARLGVVEYRGVAKLDVARGRPGFAVTEDSLITQGLAGSFRVHQKDAEGRDLREGYYNNGVFFFSNGGGEMRVEGLVRDRATALREEVWSPLATFLRYYGPRAGLAPAGEVAVAGRAGVKYQLVLVEGPAVVDAQDGDAPKSPKKLEGYVVFDADKGAPLEAKLSGELDVAPTGSGEPGKLALSLSMRVSPVEALDLRPKTFVPTIERHPLEPQPLAFLDGGTRTSTVIGGKRPAAAVEPEVEEP
jgi:hypothetical protein